MYLNCHSYFSLKYGTIPPKELIALFVDSGIRRFALTDINNTSAILDVLRQTQGLPLNVVAGIDFRNGAQQQFVALARNNQGFFELNKFLSLYSLAKKPFPEKAPDFKHCYIIYPFNNVPNHLNEYEFIGLSIGDLKKLPFSPLKKKQEKLVALQSLSFRNKREFNAHRILRAIDNNTLLSQLAKSEEGKPGDVFITEDELKEAYDDYPRLILNSERILENCSMDFQFGPNKEHNNLKSYTGNEALDFRLMKKICFEGISYRYTEVTDQILDRINNELEVIRQKGFVSYFLIAWKVLKYARGQGYFYVGRGSGANSILAYLMRITDVDPIELDLYFERFINLFRKSPPDFDIDFSWKDREDVTQYIFKRFSNVSLLGAFSTFKHRSVIREISKTFGLPDHEIKKLQSNPDQSDDISKLILKYSNVIAGFPSHITVHASGIIISEKPIYHFSATFLPPKGFPTTHFDMHIAEDIALFKFDILGQRGLAKIKDTLALIKANRPGEQVDIHNMKKMQHDKAANHLLRTGGAIGCFYVESPAMRMLLCKLRVQDYLGLVAASSVIRPGVAQSGMMREYIIRHRNIDRRKQAKKELPVLYNLMPETYGVMVYQEDVIKVAHYFADLSLAEADVLRRGMSGKYRSRDEFQEVKNKFFSNCLNKGIDGLVVQDIWSQIESFAGYAFAKGHSASYAVESYQCLYLKAYYPIEFLVATINNGGGFYSSELYIHEAKKYGAAIHLPCVNKSEAIATLYNKDIYLGLKMINGLETETVIHILFEREKNGLYSGLRDFMSRVSISLEQLILLIRSDCFRFSAKGKKELLWDAHFVLSDRRKTQPLPSLFRSGPKHFNLPDLSQNTLENLFDEMELIGFPVMHPPFQLAKDIPKELDLEAKDLPFYIGMHVTMVGYLVHTKNTSTRNGDRMHFGTFIDQSGDWIDTVVFPLVAKQYPITGPGCYLLRGKVVEEFEFVSLEITWQKRIPNKNFEA